MEAKEKHLVQRDIGVDRIKAVSRNFIRMIIVYSVRIFGSCSELSFKHLLPDISNLVIEFAMICVDVISSNYLMGRSTSMRF